MSNASLANDFAISLEKDFKELTDEAKQKTTDIIFQLFTDIVTETPVDTGLARANWNLSFDSPDDKVDKRLRNEKKKIVGARNKLLKKDLNKIGTVYISNHVVYIRRLEEGHSKKAPNGWVKTAVERARRRLK